MAQVAENVRVGVDGIIAKAPTTTALPTNATTALAAAFVDLGYVSEDGVTKSTSTTIENIRAWQRADIVRTSVTESDSTLTFTLIETKKEVIEAYLGGTVDEDGGIVENPAVNRPRELWVLDVIDGDQIIRLVMPQAQITEIGDEVFANGQPIGYEITLSAYFSQAIGGSIKRYYSAFAE